MKLHLIILSLLILYPFTQSNQLFNKLSKPKPTELEILDAYGKPCSNDKDCQETGPRLKCTKREDKVTCMVDSLQYCQKNRAEECSNVDFVCIDYVVDMVSVCAKKGTYMDSCEDQCDLDGNYTCSQVLVGHKNMNYCLVSENKSCKVEKMCETGTLCQGGICRRQSERKTMVFENKEKFAYHLKYPVTEQEYMDESIKTIKDSQAEKKRQEQSNFDMTNSEE